MARRPTQRHDRYQWLRGHHLTPLEARTLSVLARRTPALRAIIADRDKRWERFQVISKRKLEQGRWRERDLPNKWIANLGRLYHKRGWRVKGETRGRQPRMPKGTFNPWAMYRDYERVTPSKGYVSPWEVRQIRHGRTLLDKGLIFIQRRVKGGGTVSGVPQHMVEEWIRQKEVAIGRARGAHRRELIEQRERLRESLA